MQALYEPGEPLARGIVVVMVVPRAGIRERRRDLRLEQGAAERRHRLARRRSRIARRQRPSCTHKLGVDKQRRGGERIPPPSAVPTHGRSARITASASTYESTYADGWASVMGWFSAAACLV